ncbi:Inner membrane protein [Enterobacter intestinihominis]
MISQALEKETHLKWVLFTFIFAVVAVFFSVIHPVTITSGDEWINLSSGRQAYPQWGGFNPIKVVPEVSFPLFGNIASSVVMPLGFTFLEAIAYLTAILVAVLVVLFLYQFYLLMRKTAGLSTYTSSVLVIFYLLCLFGLFRTLNNNNSPYLLWEQNLTCYYHYIVPALINGTLALYVLRMSSTLKPFFYERSIFSGVLIFSIYLCVFSNIFASVLLAVMCGVVLLLNLISNRFKIVETIKDYPFHCITLAMWAISALFEMNGGRADRMAKDHLDISGTVNAFYSLLKLTDRTFFIVLTVGLVCGAVFLLRRNSDESTEGKRYAFWVSVISGAITTLALILVCAKASANYATRPVAMWGSFMYLIVAASLGLGYFIERFKAIHYFAPIVMLFLINKTTDQSHSLRESNSGNVPFSVAYAIGQDMIEQVQNAVNGNQRIMTLHVPKGDNNDNWPFPVTRGKAISETLKSNGLIPRNIEIKIQPDREMNSKYGMPI